MSKYEIKNVEGKKVGDAELSSDVYGIEPNIPVVHQVVVCQDASARQGTHSTKNRHEVSGGGVKPYRQKGTGRARQGSIRAGQWTGGGVIFGPTPRSHARRINNKMVKLAMRSVLSGKVADSELVLVDSLEFAQPSPSRQRLHFRTSVLRVSALPSSSQTTTSTPTSLSVTFLRFRSSAFLRLLLVS